MIGMEGLLETLMPAPSVEGLSTADIEYVSATEGLSAQTWEGLDSSERLEALQTLEGKLAEIQGRPPLAVIAEEMPSITNCGYFDGKALHVNAAHLEDPTYRMEVIDTIAHEGRHAYQHYAIEHPGFHPDAKEVGYWAANAETYMQPDLAVKTFGFEYYANQPMELDAVKYAGIIKSAIEQAA